MNRVMFRSRIHSICAWFVLTLFVVLLNAVIPLPFQPEAVAQDHSEDDLPVPVEPVSQMSFQPAADADQWLDFQPTGAVSVMLPFTQTEAISLGQEALNTPLSAGEQAAVTLNPQDDIAVSVNNGRLGIVVEKGTFATTVELTIAALVAQPLPAETEMLADGLPPSRLNGRLTQFQLEMQDEQQQPISVFDKPVRLVVDLREYGLDLGQVGGYFYLAYEDETRPGEWIEIPTTQYGTGGLISGEVLHFSNWSAGWRPEAWALEWRPPSVDEFTGAATYQYPFNIPPGRNGLQPQLGLSYSSGSLRGAIKQISFGSVAAGWSLGDISITRTGIENGATSWTFPDQYRLTIKGAGGRLISAGSENGAALYLVEDQPGIRVYNYGGRTWAQNQSGNSYWIVQDGSGVRYRLGYTTNSVSYQGVDSLDQGSEYDYVDIIAWHVDTVTDAFGNQINYDYMRVARGENWGFWCPWGGNCSWTVHTFNSQVSAIAYNFPGRVGSLPPVHTVSRLGDTQTPGSRLTFNYDAQNYLSEINVYHGALPYAYRRYVINSSTVEVPSPYVCDEFRVEYNAHFTLYSRTRILNWIEEQSWDPQTNGLVANLPKTVFEYQNLPHFWYDNQGCFLYKYLSAVNNGYGGRTELSYVSDNRQVGDFDNCRPLQSGGACAQKWPGMGHNYSVSRVTQMDGRSAPLIMEYNYSGICYDQDGTQQPNCKQPETTVEFGTIGGFNRVEVVKYNFDGMTALTRQITYFHHHQDGTGLDGAKRYGHPYLTEMRDGGNALLQNSETTYTEGNFGPGDSIRFLYASSVTNSQFNGDSVMSSKTVYDYNTSYQGNAQYGNLSHIIEYDDANATTPYRITRRWYYPNASNWLVNQAAVESRYDGNNVQETITITYYDGAATWTAPPEQGAVTRTRQVILPTSEGAYGCAYMPTPLAGCATVQTTVEQQYAYSAFGNLIQQTTYNDYGYRVFNSAGALVDDISPSQSHTTTIAYDAGYNLYPISATDPMSQTTLFEIYGFNGVAVDGFQTQPGLLKKVTPPNGVVSIYEYDPFGRLWATYDSEASRGDIAIRGDGDPVTLIRYWDNNWNYNGVVYLNPAGDAPFVISQQQRPGSYPAPANSSSANTAFNDQTFYDGFGRPIQTRSLWHWVEGQTLSREIISSTSYDAMGQVSCQTVPYDVQFYADRAVWPASAFISDACTSKPHTTTTYDAVGRVDIITAPDLSFTDNNYSIKNTITVGGYSRLLMHQVIDANNHVVNRFYNSRQELMQVREYEGNQAPYTDYGYTTYGYDLMGNLTAVTDAVGNVSAMTYDSLGRKVGMTDLDMGAWSYAYDAAGNLTSQVDAKVQRLCFTYDTLNRLTYKRHDSDGNGCGSTDTQLAQYIYYNNDSGAGKVGQPKEIRWSGSDAQNRETFDYDSLGRLTTHIRFVDDRSYTMGYGNFDSFNRPHTITYPSGEIITVNYDREGENSLSSNWGGALVNNVRTNARGQMTFLDRAGSIADTTYTYFGQTDAAGGGLGDSNFRLRQINSGSALQFSYTYDKVGNIQSITDNLLANTQSFGYDALNRLTTASAPGTASIAGYNHTYGYDVLGNITNNAGINYNYYDTAHKHAVTHLNNVQKFWYDANGNMTKRIEETGTYIQNFDVENRLLSVEMVGNGVTSFAYDTSGQRVKTVQPDGRILYTPFPTYEEEVWPVAATTPIVTLTANGQTAVTIPPNTAFTLQWQASNAFACEAGSSWSGSRPTSGSETMPGFSSGSRTYSLTCFNSAGSTSQTVTVTIGNLPVVTFTANGSYPNLPLKPGASFTLAWSSSGATTCVASGSWSGGKPTSGSQLMPGFSIGSRTYTLTCSNSYGATTRSIVATVMTIDPCGGSICLETSSTASTMALVTEGQTVIQRSTYSLAGQAIAVRVAGNPLATNNGLFYLYSDHLGSTSAIQKDGSTAVEQARYLPFGGWRTEPGNLPTNRGYTGHVMNNMGNGADDLGLIYMNARFYVPYIYRMVSADTIVPNPANPQSFNRYSYVRNNPINFTDPSGHSECGVAGEVCNDELPNFNKIISDWRASGAINNPKRTGALSE